MEDALNAAFASWSLPFEPAFALIISTLLYGRGWLKLHRQIPHRFPLFRLYCFLAGLAAAFLAIASPLDAFSGLLLEVHMVQHLLLMMLAPPLILLGYPFLPILTGLPKAVARDCVGPFLLWPPLRKFGAWITHPVITWSAYVASTILWHLPFFYDLALNQPAIHQLEHLCFLGTGLLFWWPVVQPWPSRPVWPRWTMIPYLLFADIQNTALSAFLSFSDQIIYPIYGQVPRLGGIPALSDQNAAGAIMWVPGSLVYLIPAAVIAFRYISPRRSLVRVTQRTRLTIHPKTRTQDSGKHWFDLLDLPGARALVTAPIFRRTMQFAMLIVALLTIWDGFFGPQVGPMNLAGVLPWTYWRGLTVLALLVFGNVFCMACPFTFVRDLGRRLLPCRFNWPRQLRSKWLVAVLVLIYLISYEAFGLWNSPWLTAWIIVGYFLAAGLVDGFFRGASFCKYVCPIGQFHFVQSLVSPFEIRRRDADVCRTCKTFDCIRGNDQQRGCELRLFQPRKSGNMDCTFCLDCIKACPHENVGIIAATPGADLWNRQFRSSVGRFSKRADLAFLVLVLVFGAFANAAGMTLPIVGWVGQFDQALGPANRPIVVIVSLLFSVIVLPLVLVALCGFAAKNFGKLSSSWTSITCEFVMSLVPLGASMWLAHFLFHLLTASNAPMPLFQTLLTNMHIPGVDTPDWTISSLSFSGLLDIEIFLLDIGLLLSLYTAWRLAIKQKAASPLFTFLPWCALSVLLFSAGIWIVFQPMQMRGTLLMIH